MLQALSVFTPLLRGRFPNDSPEHCSLSKFPGRTWTSGSARGKHVIKLVSVSCPSSWGFRAGPQSWNRGLPESGRNTKRVCNTAARSCPSWTSALKEENTCSLFLSKFGFPPGRGTRNCLPGIGRNTERACNTVVKWLCKRKTRDKTCPSSLSKFLSKSARPEVGIRACLESGPAGIGALLLGDLYHSF